MAADVKIRIGATDAASSVFGKVAIKIKGLGKSLRNLARDASRSLQSIGGGMRSMGTKAVLAGGVLVGGFAMATKTFADFDAGMASVGAISGATGKDFEALTDTAKELGASTMFSATQAAEGMKFLGQAGFTTQQILSGIGPTLSLAAAGGVELGEAADIASDISSAFGMSADEIGRVADVIAKTATSANTDVLMMGETFKTVAPLAAAAGQSLEEMSASAGLLGNSGVKASVAGTDLKNILVELSNAGKQKALKELGVDALNAAGEFRPMLDILQDLGDKTQDLTGPQKLGKLTELFGKRSAKSAIILMNQTGDSIDEMRGKMIGAEGSAKAMADRMQDSLGGVGVALNSAWEGLQIGIIGQFKTELMGAGKALVTFVRNATAFVQDNKRLVGIVAIGAVAVTAFGGVLLALGAAATAAGFAIGGIATIATTVAAVLGAVFSPVGLVIGAVAIAVGAAASSFIYLANESGLLNDAINQAKSVLVGFIDAVKVVAGGIKNAIKAGSWALAAKIAWAGLKVVFFEGLRGIYVAVKAMLPKIWQTIKSFFSLWVTTTKNVAKTVAEAIANPLESASILKSFVVGDMPAGSGISGWMDAQAEAARESLAELVKEAKAGADAIDLAVSLKDKEKPDFRKQEEIPVKGVVTDLDVKKTAKVPVLTATSSRLLTRGKNENPNIAIAENTKQTNRILKIIEENTKPKQSTGPVQSRSSVVVA